MTLMTLRALGTPRYGRVHDHFSPALSPPFHASRAPPSPANPSNRILSLPPSLCAGAQLPVLATQRGMGGVGAAGSGPHLAQQEPRRGSGARSVRSAARGTLCAHFQRGAGGARGESGGALGEWRGWGGQGVPEMAPGRAGQQRAAFGGVNPC